jgi:hypothetical protein
MLLHSFSKAQGLTHTKAGACRLFEKEFGLPEKAGCLNKPMVLSGRQIRAAGTAG